MSDLSVGDPCGLQTLSTKGSLGRTTDYRARVEVRRQKLKERISALISPTSPFVWEVGCGHGHFLTAYAAAHPEQTYIGVDLVSDRIERARRKAGRARLSHL